jgi:hypothetical protein
MGKLLYVSGTAATAVAALLAFGVMPAAAAGGPGGDYPPNGVPGKCYEKVLIPQVYESYTEQIIDMPGRTETRVIPAVYGNEIRQVVVREERIEYITVPATYRTITETVIVRPGSTRTETIPAVYETITERVLVKAEHTEWRRGVPPADRPTDPGKYKVLATGEVLCLVVVPAEYATVTRQVLKTPARSVQVDVPAETQVVTRQVIDQDARVEKRVIPAEYRSVTVRVIVTAERVETYTIPATYKTITKQRLVSDVRFEWREIVCNKESEGPAPLPTSYKPAPPRAQPAKPQQTSYLAPAPRPYEATRPTAARISASPRVVSDLQGALGMRGYYDGPRNGVFTDGTQDSLARFQSDRGLQRGLNTETLLALGVALP